MNSNNPRKKIWKFRLLMILFGLAFIAIILKLMNIQIFESEKFQIRAINQHRTKIELNANRGDIFDRNNEVIATTYTSYTIAADPAVTENPGLIAKEVNRVSNISFDKLMKKLKKKNDRYVVLAKNLFPNQVNKLKQIKDRGLIIIPQPKRLFEHKALAQVIGLTNAENNGQSGIELRWNDELKGNSGYIIMNKDGLRRLYPSADLPHSPAKDGNSLVLTIDIGLQKIVEYELMQGVLKSGAVSGTCVIIEPSTGKVLAMASYPSFDPNTRKGAYAENRRIRAITDSYEPGSTFKIITAAAALDYGTVKEDDIYNAYKGYYAGRGFKIRDVHAMDKATFREAIIHSSNIVFSQVANELKDNVFYKYIRDFGFGLIHGIELPGEVSGNVKKPKNFSGVSKRYMGHGYELTVTPLQLATAYATIANKGKMMKPYIVEKVINSKGREIDKFKPQFVRQVIKDSTAIKIAELFTAVVDSGTGQRAAINGLNIAGKTGTAQQVVDGRYSKQYYTASFAGFFPADNPNIAMVVVIDKPSRSIYGGSTAAPVFQNITSKIVSRNFYNINQIASENNDSLKVPDFIGLNTDDAENLADNLDLDIEFDNDGLVISQNIEAGKLIHKKRKIILTAKNKFTVNDSIKPDFTDYAVNRVIKILNDNDIIYEVSGIGKVKKTYWQILKNGNYKCKLICN